MNNLSLRGLLRKIVVTVKITTDMNPENVEKKAMEMINRFDSE